MFGGDVKPIQLVSILQWICASQLWTSQMFLSLSSPILDGKGFLGVSDSKESACNPGDTGLIPGSRRSLGEGNGNPLQYSCLENSMDRGAWRATVHGVTVSDTVRDWTHAQLQSKRWLDEGEWPRRLWSLGCLTRSLQWWSFWLLRETHWNRQRNWGSERRDGFLEVPDFVSGSAGIWIQSGWGFQFPSVHSTPGQWNRDSCSLALWLLVPKESTCNAGDANSISGSGRSPGVGNGNSLQYSCLGNPMDRGAWWAIVHGVTKSRTQLRTYAWPAFF